VHQRALRRARTRRSLNSIPQTCAAALGCALR
jgi:hypothetical protein